MMDEKEFTKQLHKFHKVNLDRDDHERKEGFGANSDCSSDMQIRTVMLALKGSISVGLSGDLSGIYESISMLDILHKRMTGKYYFIKN